MSYLTDKLKPISLCFTGDNKHLQIQSTLIKIKLLPNLLLFLQTYFSLSMRVRALHNRLKQMYKKLPQHLTLQLMLQLMLIRMLQLNKNVSRRMMFHLNMTRQKPKQLDRSEHKPCSLYLKRHRSGQKVRAKLGIVKQLCYNTTLYKPYISVKATYY